MIDAFTQKVQKLKSNMNLVRTLRLIWSITGWLSTLTVIMIVVESALFLTSLYIFKHLVNVIAQPLAGEEKTQRITWYLIASASATVLYVIIKAITSLVTEIQSSRMSEHIDDKIHGSAVDLDLAFYESPSYFDTLKRAKMRGLTGQRPYLQTL